MAYAQTAPAAPPVEPAPIAPAPEPAPLPPEPALTAEPPPTLGEPAAAAEPAAPEATEEAETPAPSIAGYIETGYHLNLSDTQAVPGLRSYDGLDTINGNTFLLHAVHLAISHSFSDELSATIEIDAGSDAYVTGGAVFAGQTFPFAFDVQEAYAKYAKGGFALTVGKFVTYEGIEVVEGPLNPTLTRGFLYGLAEPFTHIGLKAHYTAGGFDVGVGVVNGWDLYADNNDWKTIIARIGYASEAFFAGFSGSFGSEIPSDEDVRVSLDLTGGIIAGPVTIYFQGNYGSEGDAKWYGVGLQPLYTGDVFTFGARVEWFADPEGVRTLIDSGIDPDMPVYFVDGSFLNITLTPGFIIAEHLAVRLEFRADLALAGTVNEMDNKDVFNGESTQFTVGAGASYSW